MSSTGLEVFDKTIQTTNSWLNEIGEDLGPDRQRCYNALRAVLFALRDRLTVEEAADLSAQLPMLIRGIFYGATPVDHAAEIRSLDEFLAKINEHLQNIDLSVPTRRHVPFSGARKPHSGWRAE